MYSLALNSNSCATLLIQDVTAYITMYSIHLPFKITTVCVQTLYLCVQSLVRGLKSFPAGSLSNPLQPLYPSLVFFFFLFISTLTLSLLLTAMENNSQNHHHQHHGFSAKSSSTKERRGLDFDLNEPIIDTSFETSPLVYVPLLLFCLYV